MFISGTVLKTKLDVVMVNVILFTELSLNESLTKGLETCELPGWSLKKIIPNWLTSGCSKVMAVAV